MAKRNPEVEYQAMIVDRVATLVDAGARTLWDLVADAKGAYPTVVRDAVLDTVAQGRVSSSRGKSILGERGMEVKDGPAHGITRVPHPLDYEWRFSASGVTTLLARARKVARGDLCLIGAGSVAGEALRTGWEGRILVYEQNPPGDDVLRAAKGVEWDRRDIASGALDPGGASICIADPPWYPEYVDSFLWAGSKMTKPGGCVLLSTPGLWTRPGMEMERRMMLDRAADMGLRYVGLEDQLVAYETPLFEHNALRADGVSTPLRYWRRGDLVTFRRCAGEPGPRPGIPQSEGGWLEECCGSVRIRVREPRGGIGTSPELRSLVQGDVLPTVSRRDARRGAVDVWTSGNRVYGCDSREVFWKILTRVRERLARGADGDAHESRASEPHGLATVADQIARLLEIEEAEVEAYGGSSEYRSNGSAASCDRVTS